MRIISKTAKILGISRKTVRRAINGPLSDISRKPKSSPNKTPPNFEDLIVKEAKRTGFRYRRLKSLFERKYSLSFSKNTIKYEKNTISQIMNGISLCFPRARFTAYSYELNSNFGFSFIVFVILWLRAHNVRG